MGGRVHIPDRTVFPVGLQHWGRTGQRGGGGGSHLLCVRRCPSWRNCRVQGGLTISAIAEGIVLSRLRYIAPNHGNLWGVSQSEIGAGCTWYWLIKHDTVFLLWCLCLYVLAVWRAALLNQLPFIFPTAYFTNRPLRSQRIQCLIGLNQELFVVFECVFVLHLQWFRCSAGFFIAWQRRELCFLSVLIIITGP